jgi:hypothetical protein
MNLKDISTATHSKFKENQRMISKRRVEKLFKNTQKNNLNRKIFYSAPRKF